MKTRWLAVTLLLACASYAVAADEENPFKKAKVGDFATYKMVTKVGDRSVEGTITQTVTAKSDKEVTIKSTNKIAGMELAGQEQKIDLTKPFDPTKGNVPPGSDIKVEKLKDGAEKLKVGGKEYMAKWESYKIKGKANGVDFDSEVKVWTSPDLPLAMLKMETTGEVAGMKVETTLELAETGNKEPEKK